MFREGASMHLKVTFCGVVVTVSLVWAVTRYCQSSLVELGAGVQSHLGASINTRRCPRDARPLKPFRPVRC